MSPKQYIESSIMYSIMYSDSYGSPASLSTSVFEYLQQQYKNCCQASKAWEQGYYRL